MQKILRFKPTWDLPELFVPIEGDPFYGTDCLLSNHAKYFFP